MIIGKKPYNHNSEIGLFTRYGIDNTVSVSELIDAVKPEFFGAKGDGVTNDSDAFIEMSNYCQTNNVKRIILSNKTYIVGKQILGSSNYLTGQNIIELSNLDNIIIEGNGAILKVESGLKYGSFNPLTGLAYSPIMPFYDSSYVASLGSILSLINCSNVNISNLIIDGNSENLNIGGEWGDTGRQIHAYGIYLHNNNNVKISNVIAKKLALDGLLISNSVTTFGAIQKKYLLENVESIKNGRQGLTWTGGNNLTCINCTFSETGQNGIISSPAAGIDIESEGRNIIENGTFINCIIADNKGVGVVSDGGDTQNLHFIDSKFYGTENVAIWLKNKNITLSNCLIAGGGYNCYIADNEYDRTKFLNCKFTADEKYNGKDADYLNVLFDFTGQNPYFSNCTFISNNNNVSLPISSSSATYLNCFFKQNGNTAVGITKGTFIGINIFDIITGQNDLSGSIFFDSIKDINNKIIGINIADNVSYSDNYNSLQKLSLRGSNGNIWNNQHIYSGYIIPTTGTYKKGDIALNNNANAGEPFGWYCITAGSPGTWAIMGYIPV